MLDDSTIQAVDDIIAARSAMAGALLPILHGIQERLGHIPPASVERIAAALNLSRAEVHGVITYYHFFRSEPPGRHVVQVCRAEACRSMGSEPLWDHACASLKCGADAAPGHGATTADGRITLEPVYCLGLCALSPAVAIDGRPHARVTAARLDGLIARAGEAA